MINYRNSITLPIHDMQDKGKIVFDVIVYGYTKRQAFVIPGGSAPFIAAVKRLGLDPKRYQAWMWDL